MLNPLDPQSGYTIGFTNVTASGDTELVAAIAGHRIRLLWAVITNQGAAVIGVHLRSSATPITSTHDLAADGGGFVLNSMPGFYCQTVKGEALAINLSAGGTVSIDFGWMRAG